jgi:hypothetical protein
MPATKRRRRAAGCLSQLKVEVWACIRYLADTIENEALTRETRLRACSTLAVNAGVYRQLLETSDFEARLTALEGKVAEAIRPGRNGHR